MMAYGLGRNIALFPSIPTSFNLSIVQPPAQLIKRIKQ